MRKPIWIRYGSTTNSNIEESSPNPAAIESSQLEYYCFGLEKINIVYLKNPILFHLFGKNLKLFLLNLER